MNKALRRILWTGAVVAVPVTINAVIAARASRPDQSLPGDIGYYDWVRGRVAFYRLGQGPPLLLVHNPNAGGSAWEWRKVFPELANQHTVYAIDLLGFGLSDKPAIGYTGALYADLVHDFIDDVIDQRADAVGSGLGGAYLVNVAVRRPEALGRLVLVNPTGATHPHHPLADNLAHLSLRSPVLGETMYNTLVSHRAIERELLSHIYVDPENVTPEMVDFLYRTAHQRGSRYAVSAFIAGKLDLPMRLPFTHLPQPVLLLWGREAYYTPVGDSMDLLYRNPQARLEILDDCGMLPHDERAGEFLRLTEGFLNEPISGEMAA